MKGAEALIPLFPLRKVLFPKGGLTLGVFEPRYRAMLRDLEAAGGPWRFGIVLIQRGREVGTEADLHRVGTLAQVERRRVEGGMTFLTIRGLRRFQIAAREPGKPYPRAWVTFLPEEDGDPRLCVELASQVQASFRAYLRHIQPRGWRRVIPSEPSDLAYLVAQALQCPLSEKQALLEAPTTQARLELEAALLRRERRFLLRYGQGSSAERWGPFAVN
ncbi:LON peptidase substrate-binding domain-containing protein [Limnochorda pilosa]|uniref:LON peptidase substrate-binding domain-containing protein n=1 Tax=Limnochorda pilosa TaxID=1555112 RepID=UPI0026EEEC31|nr:LON peptidase substrate-binding domain-containing protein [Limnochorda pilosa]